MIDLLTAIVVGLILILGGISLTLRFTYLKVASLFFNNIGRNHSF